MILILAPQVDSVADALQMRISAKTSEWMRVNPDQLVFAPLWVNEISELGIGSTRIQLIDERVINSSEVRATFNRIVRLEAIQFLNEVDRNYADMEFTALYYSLLESLSMTMIFPFSLWQMQSDLINEWSLRSAAVAAGLPVTNLELTSTPRWNRLKEMIPFATDRSYPNSFYHKGDHLIWQNKPLRQQPEFSKVFHVFVAGNCVISDVVLPFEKNLLQLAAHFAAPYMELKIAVLKNGDLAVHEINTRPQTVRDEAIDALADALLQKNSQPA